MPIAAKLSELVQTRRILHHGDRHAISGLELVKPRKEANGQE